MQSFALVLAFGSTLASAQIASAVESVVDTAVAGASSVAATAIAGASSVAATAVAGASSVAVGASSANASPLPTAVTPEQSSAIIADLAAYGSSVANNDAYVASLGAAINTWLPPGEWNNWNLGGLAAAATATTDFLALATATPTYSYPSWATGLPGSLQSDWGAFATSLQIAKASIIRSDLGIADRTSLLPADTAGVNEGPTPTSNSITVNTNAAAPTSGPIGGYAGAAAGIIGLAALAL